MLASCTGARAVFRALPLVSGGQRQRSLQLLRHPGYQCRFQLPVRHFTASQSVREDEATEKAKRLHEKSDELEHETTKRHGLQKQVDDRPWHRLSGSKQYKETSPNPSRGDDSKGTSILARSFANLELTRRDCRTTAYDTNPLAEAHFTHAIPPRSRYHKRGRRRNP